MLLYLLKSATCLAILLAFYKIFLERENMHTFKRFYLLASLFAAFAIPFITFVTYVEIPVVTQITEPNNSIVPVLSSVGQEQYPTDYLPMVLWSIYFIGIVVFGFNFIKNLFQIIQRIQKNPKYKINRITNVLLLDRIIPHTFFNYIFLNKKKFEASEIPKEVLLHEETHAKQKHSVDVLFIELLQILFWFNPLIYFTKKAIKLNHEFLADKAVINNGVQPTLYQQILLEFSSNSTESSLANAINYSSIKKRFTVMKKRTSKKGILIRSLLLLTLLSTLVYGFSQKKILETYPENPHTIIGTWIDDEKESGELSFFEQDGNLMFSGGNSRPIRVQILNGEYYYFSPKSGLKPTDRRLKLPILFDSEKGTLTYSKRKYIPMEKGIKKKLYGNWENKKEGIKFIVSHSGNEIVWDVIKADGKPIRYYPKKLDGRYAFTYGKELWSFSIENDILQDTKGKTYQRISDIFESEESGQNEATPIQVNNYNSLAKNYNKLPKWRRFVQAKDLKLLADIYSKMSLNQKENAQVFPDFSQTVEEIHIHINGNGQILVQNELVPLNDLGTFLLNFNPAHTKEERASKVRAFIFSDNKPPQTIVEEVEIVLEEYGVSQINIIDPIKYSKPRRQLVIHEGATNLQINEYNTLAKKYNAISIENRKIPLSDLRILESVYRKMNESQKEKAQPFPECLPKKIQEGATKKQIKEYNALAKKYNEMDPNHMIIKKSEVVSLKEIYGLMSKKQRADAEPFPNFPEPPPAPKAPKNPKAPKVNKGEKNNLPPPPPTASNVSDVEYADSVIEDVIAHQDPYDVVGGSMDLFRSKGEVDAIPPPPSPYKGNLNYIKPSTKPSDRTGLIKTQDIMAVEEVGETVIYIPEPPTPKSPLDHVVEMAKKDAIFYYEGKKISSDKAIALLKKNKQINISTRQKGLKKPIVELSTKPIIIKK